MREIALQGGTYNGLLQTALLDLPLLKGPHSGENIAKLLSTVSDLNDTSAVIGLFMYY